MILLTPRHWLAMTGMLALLSYSGYANSAEAKVILSQDCEYILLDSSEGQILAKLIQGESPKPGDTLSGSLQARSFSELKVQRTGKTISAWVDMIDRSASKALMRYAQYCN